MEAQTSATLSKPWTDSVEGIAASHGADQYLVPILKTTRRLFPNARRLVVQMEDDMDIDEDWRLTWVIEVAMPVPQAVAAVQEWYRELFERCPPAQACIFRLGIRILD